MQDEFNYNYFTNTLKLCGLKDEELVKYLDEYKKLVNMKLFELALRYEPEIGKSLQSVQNEEEARLVLGKLRSSEKWDAINLELNQFMFKLIDDTLNAVAENATDEQKVAVVKYLDEYEARLDEMEKQQAVSSN